MSYDEILLCIFGLFLVSYIPRVLPFALLGNRELPRFFHLWLQYVPTAVFGALIFTSIFGSGAEGFRFSWENKELVASIVVLPVAAATKSLPYSIITGLVTYWAAQQIL
ncbi:MAG: AzlD domain-containing protein [Anaerovibrio sp.]|uniref:AzlD domain-containing protein n=1 Tax=Anaerovibrio sp. TaxID=1872532 RepID=UPI002619D737|nr:AzlD domain-containing protein [Anaerovibrio sp.]MDD6598324.1 AzlD domain-containing protein [Anaerovibrio sp.]MDD7678433.1 AzlD domain-containing protein [Anaerovibrio sp.]MDY2603014.1 AzlD domain-containing protein [Anaerovibrio sp.]MDY4883188.1 AzlD domain-containing protein [Anaerovibrio sp.]